MASEAKVCERCGDQLCPLLRHDGLKSWAGLKGALVSDSKIRRDLELCNGNRIASALERITKPKSGERPDADLISTCPHGYLWCHYCWRDAGFPQARS